MLEGFLGMEGKLCQNDWNQNHVEKIWIEITCKTGMDWGNLPIMTKPFRFVICNLPRWIVTNTACSLGLNVSFLSEMDF